MMTETVCGFSFNGQDVTCVKVDETVPDLRGVVMYCKLCGPMRVGDQHTCDDPMDQKADYERAQAKKREQEIAARNAILEEAIKACEEVDRDDPPNPMWEVEFEEMRQRFTDAIRGLKTGESMDQVEKGPDPFPPEEQVHVEFDREKQELRMSSKTQSFVRRHNGIEPLSPWVEE